MFTKFTKKQMGWLIWGLVVLVAIIVTFAVSVWKSPAEICFPRAVDNTSFFGVECAKTEFSSENKVFTPSEADYEEMMADAVAAYMDSENTDSEGEGDEAAVGEGGDSGIGDTTQASDSVTDAVCPATVSLDLPPGARVNEDEFGVYSYSYDITWEAPYVVEVPCGWVLSIASGTIKIDGVLYSADEDQGRVNYSTCESDSGCSYELEKYTEGHVGVTLADPQMEPSNRTVFNAVWYMFQPDTSNCGSSACTGGVYLNDLDGVDEGNFFSEAPKDESEVRAGFHSITIGDVVVAADAEALGVDLMFGGEIVGHKFTLNLEPEVIQYLSVPENGNDEVHGVVLNCDNDIHVEGESVSAGAVTLLLGNDSDNSSPEDNNWTAEVSTSDEAVCTVHFVYSDIVGRYVALVAEDDVDVHVFKSYGYEGIE